ncbi:hypothetical protein [Roseateles sp. PN1]|uniref:hypothetical protein n=1 Tax=Roseateles sp. PN1 TaxID=3137372 RepID=UPI00313A2A3E
MLTSRLLLTGAFSAFGVFGAIAALTSPAQAAPIFVDFEAVPNTVNNLATQVNPYSADLQFVTGALSVTSAWPGSPNGGTGLGNFFRDPAKYGSGTQGAVFMSGDADQNGKTSLVFNVGAGFGESFSMLFATSSGVGSVSVFDELGGAGQQLGEAQSLISTGGCKDPATGAPLADFVCEWRTATVNFSGTAKSVRISGTNTAFWLDDFRLGANGGGTIPEPGGVALSLAALGALALGRKKQVK